MSNFDSFDDFLKCCETCRVCKEKSKMSFQLVDFSNMWFDSYESIIEDNILKFYGVITKTKANSETEDEVFCQFDLFINLKNKTFEVESKFFPDSFEFFIESHCNHCNSWYLSTKDIIVLKDNICNFDIEIETISIDEYCLSIDYESNILEVYDANEEVHMMDIDLADSNFDFTNPHKLNDQIQKYLLLY